MEILLVEDDINLSNAITKLLTYNGYKVSQVFDGIKAKDEILNNNYALVILDIMLPKLDGMSVLKIVRDSKNNVPIIMLTAKSQTDDIVDGLEHGCDDYITKPFNTKELLARMKAVLKRTSEIIPQNDSIVIKSLNLNKKTYTISNKQTTLQLTSKEFKILEVLWLNQDKITTIDEILIKVWGYDDGEVNTVWTYISYLRKKLKMLDSNVSIKMIRNVGYKLEVK